MTMGPACAQRGVESGLDDSEAQLSFEGELGSQKKAEVFRPPAFRAFSQRPLPAHLSEQYQTAKMAFDELFRELCKNGTLLYGEKALAFDHMLSAGDYDIYSFDDPLLIWLEPEHELQLFLSKDGHTAFHRRSMNGTVSLLHFEADRSPIAKQLIQEIKRFCQSLRRYRAQENMTQLSLFCTDFSGER